MKWGFEHSRTRLNQPYFNNNRGTFAFQDRWTGHIGDFLLGMLNSTPHRWQESQLLRATSMGGSSMTISSATPNLTLNLGMRYELNMPPHDRYDRMSNFVPELGKIVIASGANTRIEATLTRAGLRERVTFAAETGLPRSLVYADYTNIAPRVGFAWRASGARRR